MDSAEDFQAPDESRPPKRVRLEGSLDVTADTQQEMMDDDDWDDVYGDSKDDLATHTPTKDNHLDTIQHTQSTSNGYNPSDLATPVAVKDSSDVVSKNEAGVGEDGISADMISQGDELVAPGPTMDDTDALSNKVMQEAVEIEVQPPSSDQDMKDSANGEGKSKIVEEIAKTNTRNSDASRSGLKPSEDTEFLEAAAAQKGDDNAEWQFDSSDAESSSDSDSTDSDDSSEEADSDGGYEMLDPATAAKMLMSGDGDDDDGDNNKSRGGAGQQPRTANEVAEAAVPKPDVVITPDMKITLLGTIEQTVEKLALIKGVTPGEYQVLDSGSVLCTEDRKVVGAVAETFGRVQEPMYSIAFADEKDIEEAGLKHGTKIFYLDSHSTFVFTQPLKNLKGTDASNIHDEEVGEDEMEFSDDEKEAEYKRQKKLAKKAGRGGLSRSAFNEAESASGLGTTGPSGSTSFGSGGNDAPLQSYGGGMTYDDNDDVAEEFYQPLKRPDNLSQLMAGGAPPPRMQRSSDRGRGKNRGDRNRRRPDRGRGKDGFDGQDHRGSGRGGSQLQPSTHRGNSRTFPDRFNIQSDGWQNQASSQKPNGAQEAYPRSLQQGNALNPAHNQHQQRPQTYQFNGQTYQYGLPNPPAAQQTYLPPQPYHLPQQPQQQSQSTGHAPMPAGAYVNPSFFPQQVQQPIYPGWSVPQPPQPQYQQQPQGQPYGAAPAVPQNGQAQQPIDLAEIMRKLGNQQPQ